MCRIIPVVTHAFYGDYMNQLTKQDLAYLAGMIDGDGFIWNGTDAEGYSTCRMGISQNNRSYLEQWKDRIGSGYIQEVGSKYGSCLTYSITPGPTRKLCELIAPYLRLKREKALEAIVFTVNTDRTKGMLWPYLAGFVDAEGTMGIYESKQKGLNSRGEPKRFDTVRFHIPQLDRGFLESLRDEIGFGSVVRRGKSGSGKQMWNLAFGGAQAKKVAKKIRPYLIIKADAADLILAQQHKERHDSATERPEAQEAERLYLSGMSAAAVAKQMGYKPAAVNYWLRQMGVTRSHKDAQRLRRDNEI